MCYYLAELEHGFPKIIMKSNDLDTILLNRKDNQIILKEVILSKDEQSKVSNAPSPATIEEY